MKCGWCHGSIESHPDWELKDCLAELSQQYQQLNERISELEKQVSRVPGSIPGDYTWDELVGKHED